jgi:hypothetical protein
MRSTSSWKWLRSRESFSPRDGSVQTPGSASFCSISERDFRRAASSKIAPNIAGPAAKILVAVENLFGHQLL